MWSRILRSLFPVTVKEFLTPEMCAEITRLGLDHERFQRVVDREGIAAARSRLAHDAREARLFEKWCPRVREFVAAKRESVPFPKRDSLDVVCSAICRILEPMIREAERLPRGRKNAVNFFVAPLYILPFVAKQWPAEYPNAILISPEESREWWDIYEAEKGPDERDDDFSWYVKYWWIAEANPPLDLECLQRIRHRVTDGVIPVLVTEGLQWGMLAGGSTTVLWEIDGSGTENRIGPVWDETY